MSFVFSGRSQQHACKSLFLLVYVLLLSCFLALGKLRAGKGVVNQAVEEPALFCRPGGRGVGDKGTAGSSLSFLWVFFLRSIVFSNLQVIISICSSLYFLITILSLLTKEC